MKISLDTEILNSRICKVHRIQILHYSFPEQKALGDSNLLSEIHYLCYAKETFHPKMNIRGNYSVNLNVYTDVNWDLGDANDK